jgi:hypothetical protein
MIISLNRIPKLVPAGEKIRFLARPEPGVPHLDRRINEHADIHQVAQFGA